MSMRAQRASQIKAVTIRVSHAWEKDENGLPKGPRIDSRWKQLRSAIKSVLDEVEKRLANRVPAVAVPSGISRLRARHGGWILGTLVERLCETDIYIADLSNDAGDGLNANVLLETGMAIAIGLGSGGNMYLLIPSDLPAPSDMPLPLVPAQ